MQEQDNIRNEHLQHGTTSDDPDQMRMHRRMQEEARNRELNLDSDQQQMGSNRQPSWMGESDENRPGRGVPDDDLGVHSQVQQGHDETVESGNQQQMSGSGEDAGPQPSWMGESDEQRSR